MLPLTPRSELIYEDASGSTAACIVRFPVGTTVTAALDASNAFRAVVASLTGCALVRLRIRYELRPEDIGTPIDGVSIARCAAFYFDCDGDIPGAIVTIPGYIGAEISPIAPECYPMIDVSDSDVNAFISAVLDAQIDNPFGEAVLSLGTAYVISRV